jgi:hypothetical protein
MDEGTNADPRWVVLFAAGTQALLQLGGTRTIQTGAIAAYRNKPINDQTGCKHLFQAPANGGGNVPQGRDRNPS